MTAKSATQTGTMTRRAVLGLTLAAALPLTVGRRIQRAAAQSVPETWMYAGNAARTGAFPGSGPDREQDIVELWRIDGIQTGVLIEPCGVCQGMAYYLPIPDGVSGDITPLVAVDARTGTELWRHDPPVTEPPTFFRGKPAISDGLLVMPTYTGLLVGLDAKSGEERWVFDLQGQTADCRLAIVDGVAYVSDSASVNAVKVGDTAEWLWKSPLGDGATTVVSGTVSVDGEYVVVSSVTPVPESELEEKSTDIHVLNATDGAEAYRYQFLDMGESYQFALQNEMIYSRVDNAYLGRSHLFSMTLDGTERWRSRTSLGAVPAYPAVSGELFYLVFDDGVWGHNAATGQMAWTSPPLQQLNPDIALIDDVIYVGAAPPTPTIFALSATDGALLQSIAAPFEGAQVIGSTDGILIAKSGVNLVGFGNPT